MRKFLATVCAVWWCASAHAQTLSPQMFTSRMSAGGIAPDYIAWWGIGYFDAPVNFDNAGLYNITVNAWGYFPSTPPSYGALMQVTLDYFPIDHGADAVSQSNYMFAVTNTYPPPAPYSAQVYVTQGAHTIGVGCYDCYSGLNLGISDVIITPVYLVPSEPLGSRDPTVQPFRSYSVWNTAIGSAAQWSNPTDPDTVTIRSGTPTINSSQWSIPVYVASPTDPVTTFTMPPNASYPFPTVSLPAPAGITPAPPLSGGDHHVALFDSTHRWLHNFYGCMSGTGGFSCGSKEIVDVCSAGDATGGWSIGLIRTSEIQAGVIPHVLRYSIAKSQTSGGPTPVNGNAWPAVAAPDGCSPSCYTGNVQAGSTIGIPASVNLSALGLSAPGLVLATALQNYGAMQRDTGGNGGVIFYAEQGAATVVPTQLNAMYTDLAKIVPLLAIMRNQGPTSINGGGVPRMPAAPRIDPNICPNP